MIKTKQVGALSLMIIHYLLKYKYFIACTCKSLVKLCVSSLSCISLWDQCNTHTTYMTKKQNVFQTL